jgi:molecular chaperone DnaK
VIEYLIAEFKKDQGIDLSKDPMAMQRLREAAEKAKIELSSAQQTDINLPYITADQSGPKHLNDEADAGQVRAARRRPGRAHPRAVPAGAPGRRLKASEIDEVVLVGGSTRMPLVQQKVKELFGKEPNKT